MPSPALLLTFFAVLSFSLATLLQPTAANLGKRAQSDDILKVVLGDARRLFANHFFTKADVYFHSGYYPSFFDQAYQKQAAPDTKQHLTEMHEEHGHGDHDEEAHEKAMDFLGKPQDWIDGFGRHFYSSHHSHLDKPGEAREILPWLRLSAELNPEQVDAYTVGAYWLEHMNKVDEAESFLREGLRAAPWSYEILFELGKLNNEYRHNPTLARNLWELALTRWQKQDDEGRDPDVKIYTAILANLSDLEEKQGNLPAELEYKEREVEVSPAADTIQKQIDELKQKIAKGK